MPQDTNTAKILLEIDVLLKKLDDAGTLKHVEAYQTAYGFIIPTPYKNADQVCDVIRKHLK